MMMQAGFQSITPKANQVNSTLVQPVHTQVGPPTNTGHASTLSFSWGGGAQRDWAEKGEGGMKREGGVTIGNGLNSAVVT